MSLDSGVVYLVNMNTVLAITRWPCRNLFRHGDSGRAHFHDVPRPHGVNEHITSNFFSIRDAPHRGFQVSLVSTLFEQRIIVSVVTDDCISNIVEK